MRPFAVRSFEELAAIEAKIIVSGCAGVSYLACLNGRIYRITVEVSR